jgi:dTDP-4-dehydrorhamnose reductase
MKLLVTGANGFVAGSVLAQAGVDWEVHAVSRREAAADTSHIHWHKCDTLARRDLVEVMRRIRPDAIIHTAAIADIDLAERDRNLARAVNVEMTQVLADGCAEFGARMVFCSTDNIFDGEHAPYRETDAAVPRNYYAQTKVEAERCVLPLGNRAVIARLALVAGLPMLGSGNSFVARLLATLKGGGKITVPASHEIRSPIDIITAAAALLELAAGDHHGTFHLAGNDRLNRLELTKRVVANLGYPVELVSAVEGKPDPGRAKRPRDVSLDNSKARARLKTPMRSFDEGLSLKLERTNGARSS